MTVRQRQPAVVLLDIDGTLVDTTYHHAIAWWRAFQRHGHDVTVTEVHRRIGMGSDQLVESILGRHDAEVKQAHSHYYAPALQELRRLPGARELVRHCADRGLTVVLATSSKPEQVDMLVATLDAGDAVAHVTDAGDAEQAKPAPDLLQAALDEVGGRPGRAVLVGDTVWDVGAARQAGLPCVGVLTGGISEVELREAGAVAVYRDPAALLDGFDASPLARLLEQATVKR